MRTRYTKVLQFLLFLVVGTAILFWLYRDQDPQELLTAIKYDVNYWWILASLFAGLMSNISRTIRWQMLITPLGGKKPGFINTFLALSIGYIANLAIPRMGEVSRCAILSKHENLSFTQLIGTVVAERALDIISMLTYLLLAIILQFGILNSMTGSSFDFTKLYSSFTTPIPYIILLFLAITLWLFRNKIRNSRAFYKIKGLWKKFRQGFLSFRNVDNKPWFIGHTILVFIFYFLMMYLNFFAFDYTHHLSPLAALTVFVFGTLGMIAPVQGGIGPWHFMVITSLTAYGISSTDAGIFALVVHGALNIMIILLGLLSLLALPFVNKKRK